MMLRFTKMHGLGNDFVVIDAINQNVDLSREQAKFLADRHFGVGCDQILVVEPPTQPGVDFRYRIFNSDGGEVEQCGNGARCFVQFVHERGLALKRELRVETRGGIIVPRREDDGEVTVVMGVPRFKPSELPFLTESEALVQPLEVDGETAYITALSMGNPHAVQVVADVDAAPVTTQGAAIERHPRFPNRVNAGYLQVLNPQHIRLRVYERGAGETLSCGTGACAAAVAGILRGLLVSPVRVTTPGGDLRIAWDGAGKPVMLTGPATTVYHGEIEI